MREMLKTHPFCACSFSLAKIREWEKLPARLEEIVAAGRESFRASLSAASQALIPLVENFYIEYNNDEFSQAASHLAEILKNDFEEISLLTSGELLVLRKIFAGLSVASLRQIELANETVLERI